MLTGWLLNGDSVSIVKYADRPEALNPYRLRLHLVEADRLSSPDLYTGVTAPLALWGGGSIEFPSYMELPAGGAIQNGVETDASGKVVANGLVTSIRTPCFRQESRLTGRASKRSCYQTKRVPRAFRPSLPTFHQEPDFERFRPVHLKKLPNNI
ncbi:hypothetical protein ACFFNY_11425 [Paenibacillus hodogayensis]|uniref:Uncharacterized protein n=1 Tax=Paenibacillus hodogayensis TaxID=279208 RepID=A0ABV5VVY3_9BACL